ncbi:hypothetical protein EVAR_10204_1 [Eumeta japonica]|uniref:Uncharacterized protein n=1 Tax=Eumeta variegata TaxID=151549 RepID=A0A4C1TG30_EUMVA|nr:hypothetical protein EVAR_10204_1 [Eumeta japonica]
MSRAMSFSWLDRKVNEVVAFASLTLESVVEVPHTARRRIHERVVIVVAGVGSFLRLIETDRYLASAIVSVLFLVRASSRTHGCFVCFVVCFFLFASAYLIACVVRSRRAARGRLSARGERDVAGVVASRLGAVSLAEGLSSLIFLIASSPYSERANFVGEPRRERSFGPRISSGRVALRAVKKFNFVANRVTRASATYGRIGIREEFYLMRLAVRFLNGHPRGRRAVGVFQPPASPPAQRIRDGSPSGNIESSRVFIEHLYADVCREREIERQISFETDRFVGSVSLSPPLKRDCRLHLAREPRAARRRAGVEGRPGCVSFVKRLVAGGSPLSHRGGGAARSPWDLVGAGGRQRRPRGRARRQNLSESCHLGYVLIGSHYPSADREEIY